jgi:hypothetical protein
MKYISRIMVALVVLAVAITACNKVGDLPNYGSTTGTTSVLTADKTTLAALPADSNNVGITFSWTNPKYATDSASQKFVLEIDSAGKNFSKGVTKIVTGALKTSFTNKEMNNILLGFGFQFNVAYGVDIRLTTSYGNNNEKIVCNTIKVMMTPYKVPPKVALPTSGKLFIVGNATPGGDATGWNNPVPVPTQELSRIDETTWGGIFNLNGGKEYLLLPVNGDWTNKFSVANKSIAGLSAGGDFGFNLADNFPGPATSGWYKIIIDFQAGKFTVTPFTSTLPTNLFMVGDATPGGWNNPVPVPSQQFTRLNSSEWTLTLNNVVASKEYLLLPVNGDWSNKYSVANKNVTGLSAGGDFGYNLPDNFPGPSVAGNYKIDVNFVTMKFKTTKL